METIHTSLASDINGSQTRESTESLKRKLKSRHLTMIAIGGTIGTGLFLGSGSSISSAGPGGALLSYILIGIMVYFVVSSLGEMAAFLPIAGSFEAYASKFVDPALGFALGWNYWFLWASAIPAELSAGAFIMQYWFPQVTAVLWSAIFMALILVLNIFSVKGYGEGEYWFSMIKVTAVIVFIIIGLGMIVGIFDGHAVGFHNFLLGGTPFHGGFTTVFGVLLIAGFAFSGAELVGLTAGESATPSTSVPKAIRQVFWRILIFYVLAIVVIGFILPYTDPRLLNSNINAIAYSPFTLVFQRAGFAFAASLMNAVILTAVLSAGNSAMYASSRMIWALAKSGKAPQAFSRVNSKGVPLHAIYLTTAIGFLSFLSSLFGNGVVYNWLLNIGGLSGFIAWLGISISHYRFRKAYIRQGRDINRLPYRAKFYPFGPIFSIIVGILIVFGQDYSAFTGSSVNWTSLLTTYIGIPVFILLWLGYKYVKKTKVIPLLDCDFEYRDA